MRAGRWLLAAPVAVTALTYAGYPGLLALVVRCAAPRFPASDAGARRLASVTVVVAAYDEEQVIEAKIEDLRRQDYPGHLRVLVVADGSDDATSQLAAAAGAEVLHDPDRAGKSAAVNRGIAAADTDLVVLTDANCLLAPGALRALVDEFADPAVAVVGGVKSVGGDSAQGRGEGLYWRYETALKTAESRLGVVPGAVGELVALRRSTVRPIPPEVINDDYHLACTALADGHRVHCAAGARTYEPGSVSPGDELERRTRVAAGTWQTTLMHLRLLDPRRGHIAWVFAGHRVLRTMLTPSALPVLLVSSIWLSRSGTRADAGTAAAARVLLTSQLLLYGGAMASLRAPSPLLAAPYAFVSTNLAMLRGGVRYLRGRQPVAWARVDRPVEPAGPANPAAFRGVSIPSGAA